MTRKYGKYLFASVATTMIVSSAFVSLPEEIEAKGKQTSTVANVSTFKEFKSAINNKTIKTINIQKDINLDNQLVITSNKSINGNGHTLKAKSNKSEALRFINTTSSISDLSITGAKHAIEVKGSFVTLDGTINVSGNKSGGIKVEGDSGKKHQTILNVTNAKLINENETGNTPTIIEEKIKTNTSNIIGLDNLYVEYNDGNQIQRFIYINDGLKPPKPLDIDAPTIQSIDVIGNGYSKTDLQTNTVFLNEGFETSKIVLTMSESITLNGKKVTGQREDGKNVTYGTIELDPKVKNSLIITPSKEHQKAAAAGTVKLDLDEGITIKDAKGNKFDGLLTINISPIIVELIAPPEQTVVVGEKVNLPSTIKAKISNGSIKEVPVSWSPKEIDTTIPGERVVTGTVEGFSGSIILKVFVIETGPAQISLFKDSTSSNNKIDFANISNFYLKNINTGKTYYTGTIPSQATRKNQFLMKDIPEGKYTIHLDTPDGLSVDFIELGETYKETVYHPITNPLVIKKQPASSSNYIKIVLKAKTTLAEIKPLETLSVPVDISYNDFVNALPKKSTIVDSTGKEHQVDLSWDIRPFNFGNYKKPGQITLSSEFFILPLSVSNSDPATRLEVKLTVNFEEEVVEEGPPYYAESIKFKVTPNGSTFSTSNKEMEFYKDDIGLKVIKIYMGDGSGTFEEKVGNITIKEMHDNGMVWYRVYTESEYFASETQLWRVNANNVDTSTEGVVQLNKTLGPYLSIQSNAFYKWFTE